MTVKRFYLSGQHTFSNRGCEALVRSTVLLLREALGDVEVLVPTSQPHLDSFQWPEAESLGVQWVPAYLPHWMRYWVNLQHYCAPFQSLGWPFRLPEEHQRHLKSVDAVLAIGGDNYSLDYKTPSLFMGLDQAAMQLGKPVFLWGGSVGPFEKQPVFKKRVRAHLSQMQWIFARESFTYRYLHKELNLNNVSLMPDPAFVLPADPLVEARFMRRPNRPLVGVNFSPLLSRFSSLEMHGLAADFVRWLVIEKGMQVVLIPHVNPLDEVGGDYAFLHQLKVNLLSLGDEVQLLPSHLNAIKLKHSIAKMDYFVGARTHATLAALSSGVPCLSLGYSIKAQGINHDLLGHQQAVLGLQELSLASLKERFSWLEKNKSFMAAQLSLATIQQRWSLSQAVDLMLSKL